MILICLIAVAVVVIVNNLIVSRLRFVLLFQQKLIIYMFFDLQMDEKSFAKSDLQVKDPEVKNLQFFERV